MTRPNRCGTITGMYDHYDRGERTCERCRRFYTRHQNLYRMDVAKHGPILVSTLGVRRRIQALAWMGWSYQAIADNAGIHHDRSLGNILKRPTIRRDTAAKIDAAYRRLCMEPGPSPKTAQRARAKGWLSALVWDNIDDPNEDHELESARLRRREEDRRRYRSTPKSKRKLVNDRKNAAAKAKRREAQAA
jgi:hypothetical protein